MFWQLVAAGSAYALGALTFDRMVLAGPPKLKRNWQSRYALIWPALLVAAVIYAILLNRR